MHAEEVILLFGSAGSQVCFISSELNRRGCLCPAPPKPGLSRDESIPYGVAITTGGIGSPKHKLH